MVDPVAVDVPAGDLAAWTDFVERGPLAGSVPGIRVVMRRESAAAEHQAVREVGAVDQSPTMTRSSADVQKLLVDPAKP